MALNWAQCIRDEWDVTLGLHSRKVDLPWTRSLPVDLSSASSFEGVLKQVKPSLVIHTVALTDVDRCEREPELAKYVNATLARNVAEACYGLGIKLVHISTDHLFDGTKSFYTELDSVCPLNVYGKTKALAEELVLGACPESLNIRTNFYGWGPSYRQSFSDGIIKSLRIKKNKSLSQDVYFSPILAGTLAKVVHELLENGELGIFNVVGEERVSKYEFGLALARVFNLNSQAIVPVSPSLPQKKVQRPNDMSLSNNKTKKIIKGAIGGIMQHITQLRDFEGTTAFKELVHL
mgnify:CR=1 FL=1